MLILGIETSCDETGVAVFDTATKKILSNVIFSQIDLHKTYGGVVPEIASRSQFEKIDIITTEALQHANVLLDDIDVVAVTTTPGLVGSLLVGTCFAKGIAWSKNKKIIGVNHLEGHIFSSFLRSDMSVNDDIKFPCIVLSASGGHTSLYLVHDFGKYTLLGETLDDAAGEAFDKISKLLGLGYPGGAIIEQYASNVNFHDFIHYPRNKVRNTIQYSFSGLKTAVLYDLVSKGAYDLVHGPIYNNITKELQEQVASSLLVCVGDIFVSSIKLAFKLYPMVKSFCFVGGVACNKYLQQKIKHLCVQHNKSFFVPAQQFCMDNGGMVAFVGGYKAEQGIFSDITLDVLKAAT